MRRFLSLLLAAALAAASPYGPAQAQVRGEAPFSVPVPVGVVNGGTGAATASGARTSLSAAARDFSDVTVGTDKDNLGLVRDLVKDFGATCDGTTDNATPFANATAWLATGPGNRLVTIPASASGCATSATVALGDGRQQSTTLGALLTGTPTTATVASCSGVSANDSMVVIRNDASVFNATVSSCVSTTLTFSPAYSGGDANSGNVVYTGIRSSYTGGGFVGYGPCMISGSAYHPAVSTIKYIGSAAPTTTLSATASATNVTLTVASISNINIGDPLRVTLDSGATFWTHVIETPTGSTVKIANEVPSTATSGNAVTIANNPIVRVNGWMLAPVVKNLCLDANNLAGVGLDTMSAFRGDFQGLTAWNYTGVGFYLRSTEAYLGVSAGSADNDFGLSALIPQNNQAIGLWANGAARRNVAFSRNRFWGGNIVSGGLDAAAAAIREEFADNNTWIKAYTSRPNGTDVSGAGLYRMPSFYQAVNFPQENTFIGPALIGSVTNGTATGKSVGIDYATAYATSDGETVPTAGVVGVTAAGKRFPDPYSYGSTVSAPTGTTTTASFVMMGLAGAYTPNSSGAIEITISGMVTNSTISDGINFYVARGTGTAPSNGAAATGAQCSQVYTYTAMVAGANGKVPFTATCITTGLVVGTAYWIDLAFQAITGGTASASSVRVAVKEL